jgi:riboflavin synthase
MFTGLIEAVGTVFSLIQEPFGLRILVESELFLQDAQKGQEGGDVTAVKLGDSIAINGCCLTAISLDGKVIGFQAGEETLRKTNLGELNVGSKVNLERSLKVGDRMGGHFVTGHIDGLGRLRDKQLQGDWAYYYFDVPEPLRLHLASKGSIAVDGISLTVVDVDSQGFSVALIPHTLQATTLGVRNVGDQVNLETDVLAKYVARQFQGR